MPPKAEAPAPPAAKDAKTAKPTLAEKGEAAKKDKFTRVFNGAKAITPDGKKLAPQAQVIVNAIEAHGKGGVGREELIAELQPLLTTKQTPGRILTYYQKGLVEDGWIRMDRAA